MTTHVNDSGAWREPTEVHVNDAGTWRSIQEIHVNDSGTWRQVFSAQQISISDTSVASVGVGTQTATFGLETDGDIYKTENGSTSDIGDWLSPKTNMNLYECRATLTSGSFASTNSASGVWSSLGSPPSDRFWTITRSTVGTSTTQFTLEIRRVSDGTILDTATITLFATRTA